MNKKRRKNNFLPKDNDPFIMRVKGTDSMPKSSIDVKCISFLLIAEIRSVILRIMPRCSSCS